jgi:hypothetical protein
MDPEERLAAIEDAIGQLAEVIGQIAEKVDWHDKQLDDSNSESLAAQLKAVTSDFGSMIGGFNGILADRKKARYANMVGAHEGLKAYAPRYAKTFKSDLVGDAVECILAFLQQEGASEEGIPGVLDQIVSELKARLDEEQAEGTPEHEAMESPAEESAEHAPGGSESGPEGISPKGKALEIEVKTGDLPPELAEEARRFRGRKPA